jgi:hypothetical protein
MEKHPGERTNLMNPYTVVKREGDRLKSVPYHVEYAQWLNPASLLLRKAAQRTENGSLAKYLLSRAMALVTDDYYQSDVDWIDLNGNDVDMICGPYEVYDDSLMGLKASYEATVGVKEHEESAILDKFTRHLDALEIHLPHNNKYKRSIAGLVSPMVVMSDIIRGGDIATGYQAVAANLPNDPRVHTTKGTKKTFWKNMMTARLEQIVLPIGREILDGGQIALLTSRGMLHFILLHELCHALGPRYVYGKSDSLSVNHALRDLYPAIEEGKADLAGLHSMKYFVSRGLIPQTMEREVYVSYLASMFRTIRFGTAEAHGKAALCELNGLWDRGAIFYDETTKRWSVRFDAMGEAISSLAEEYLTIQATGDLNRATDFFKRWSSIPREIEATLHAIDHLPVDIEPIYTIHWN